MKVFEVVGLRARVVDVPLVLFVVLAILGPLAMMFLFEAQHRVTAMDIWWGVSLMFWVYLLIWILRLDGVRSPIWNWCPPFVIGRNLDPMLRYGIFLLLFLGSGMGMGIYVMQRIRGEI